MAETNNFYKPLGPRQQAKPQRNGPVVVEQKPRRPPRPRAMSFAKSPVSEGIDDQVKFDAVFEQVMELSDEELEKLIGHSGYSASYAHAWMRRTSLPPK